MLYYQKAFFYVSAFIYILLGGALKPTLVATVGIFLVVGAYGMRCALAVVTRSRLLCTVGSVGFLFTNYVFTDWLPRGDLPEFSALMIVPWLLYWCLHLVVRRRVSLLLIPIMVLLVEAHSAIALISIFTLLVAMITFLAEAGLRGLRVIAPRLAIAVGGSALILAPTLLAELRMARFYDPSSKVTHYASISHDFYSFGLYLFDGSYRWLANNSHVLVQIDFAIWIPIAVALASIVLLFFCTRAGIRSIKIPFNLDTHILSFLGATLIVYLFLQLRISLFIYDIISPLQAIDYPFRMLAFITPLGIILVVFIFNTVYSKYRANLVAKVIPIFWLASFIVLSPVTAAWQESFAPLAKPNQFPSTDLSAPPANIDYRTFAGFFTLNNGFLYDEYLPKVFTSNGTELYDDGDLYKRLHGHQYGAASLSHVPCSVEPPSHVPLESLQLTFEVQCAGPTRLALPISYNAYTTILVAADGKHLRKISYLHVPSDPRIVINVPTSRRESVVVHLPTLWGVLS